MAKNINNKTLASNVVPKKALRKAYHYTLNDLKDVIFNTAGPMGSQTSLIHEKRFSEYSKDGFTVLQEIKYPTIIENNIVQEMIELARHIKNTVGDGSSSLVILTAIIFDKLCEYERLSGLSTYQVTKAFREVVEDVKEKILSNGRECTLEDIYDICMISTNGNEEISNAITDIYKQYGLDVYIDLSTSNDADHHVVSYEGMTLAAGYSDQAYINSLTDAVSEINNASIYAFTDPVDTPEMVAFFDKILSDNIIMPYQMHQLDKVKPTVILAPRLSRDLSSSITSLTDWLYNFDKQNQQDQKPPVLVISNIVFEEDYDDIIKLCGCKEIHKYINAEVQKQDQADGKAPTLENISTWCGHADSVQADAMVTKFINPENMFEHDEEGNRVGEAGEGHIYKALIDFLERELANAKMNADDAVTTNRIKRRLHSLKANLVKYLIGGITVADRDSAKGAAKDAIFNCRSAAVNGVGRAANVEALIALNELKMYEAEDLSEISIKEDIANLLFYSYEQFLTELYSTAVGHENAVGLVEDTLLREFKPYNMRTLKFDGTVKSSIMSDVTILDTIARVITISYSANQAILPEFVQNVYKCYLDEDDE